MVDLKVLDTQFAYAENEIFLGRRLSELDRTDAPFKLLLILVGCIVEFQSLSVG
jgi:hypothetical protein